MHIFQINVLIEFLMSSTYFEHHVFIIRKTICICNFMVCFSCIYVSSLAGGMWCLILSYSCTFKVGCPFLWINPMSRIRQRYLRENVSGLV